MFAFGDAGFHGSLPSEHIAESKPVVGIAATPSGQGYTRHGRLVLIVRYTGTRRSAQRAYRRFLARYRDRGTGYAPSYRRYRSVSRKEHCTEPPTRGSAPREACT